MPRASPATIAARTKRIIWNPPYRARRTSPIDAHPEPQVLAAAHGDPFGIGHVAHVAEEPQIEANPRAVGDEPDRPAADVHRKQALAEWDGVEPVHFVGAQHPEAAGRVRAQSILVPPLRSGHHHVAHQARTWLLVMMSDRSGQFGIVEEAGHEQRGPFEPDRTAPDPRDGDADGAVGAVARKFRIRKRGVAAELPSEERRELPLGSRRPRAHQDCRGENQDAAPGRHARRDHVKRRRKMAAKIERVTSPDSSW